MKVAPAATARSAGRVLVVEDERDVAELIRYNLTREGYDVVVAGSGDDAIKQAREVQPDLVLLDIMVLKSTAGVCRRLKQDADARHPRHHGDRSGGGGRQGPRLRDGADDYVKALPPRELVARVRAVVRRGRREERPAQLKAGDLRSTATASRCA